ncbi:hypothetical protein [Haloglycomyces albus]|uniref:hypothetical protein n=1 Tax=Haloglycomyces albus TaxID=526067 RepID=UPI00046D506C|nr:hypothetical protein [Haloglycomyces albus]
MYRYSIAYTVTCAPGSATGADYVESATPLTDAALDRYITELEAELSASQSRPVTVRVSNINEISKKEPAV